MRSIFFALCCALTASCLPSAEASDPPVGPGCIAAACEHGAEQAVDEAAGGDALPAGTRSTGDRARLPEALSTEQNAVGGPLAPCSVEPMTGFFRDGFCVTGPRDRGVHVVCAEVNDAFLNYTAERGNDLSTPAPQWRFPGLAPGDRWCLCASRWEEARRAGVAPAVVIEASDAAALRIVDRADLVRHAVTPP
ncbi:MAG: hypothetical protein ACI82G_001307 [Bradymonadia bacterium]|jgi:uncharacterized protein (DUF2237 family)